MSQLTIHCLAQIIRDIDDLGRLVTVVGLVHDLLKPVHLLRLLMSWCASPPWCQCCRGYISDPFSTTFYLDTRCFNLCWGPTTWVTMYGHVKPHMNWITDNMFLFLLTT